MCKQTNDIPLAILEVADEWNAMLYEFGLTKPHYPLPVRLEDVRVSFITNLWLHSKHGRQERKVRKWWLAMCFDYRNYYLG